MFFLMVFFSTVDQPEPHFEHGYFPREASSLEQCLTWRSQTQTYLGANLAKGAKAKVFCARAKMDGYIEALASFKAAIGDPT